MTTKLKPELVDRIKSLCMHGPNVMLNSNMMLNLLTYVDHLEKLADHAFDAADSINRYDADEFSAVSVGLAKKINERIERANTAAAITNTSPAQHVPVPPVQQRIPLERRGDYAFEPHVPGVMVIPSLAHAFDGTIQFIEKMRYVLDTEACCIIAYTENGTEYARHPVSSEDVQRITNAGKSAPYSMGFKVDAAP